ncbi:protease complex subunit PrcB family protein [Bacillus sp. V5-8f]|uniref:protease complex subunit PrcB family protein n=1 Tax=Bacillus sp. V5-8f TaxID=2053044 RepID=UPI000C77D42B|nr:protease complex subunit PrcB family protein [Bacillus sp. V5-8f]PLT32600.1 hypothetical protein CUU64_18190 [Bacillus sp. V5-8f]
MRKFFLVLLVSIFVSTSASSVFAEEIKPPPAESTQFQLVHEAQLSDVEKAFFKIAKEHKGVHKFGSLYVIAAGPKPNAGYRLTFEKQEQLFEQMNIYVKHTTPEPGRSYAQVIVNPSIIARIDLPPYTTLSVLDAETKKPFVEEDNFSLDFHTKKTTNLPRKGWTIKSDTNITKSELENYQISVKKLGVMEKEIPIILRVDKKNKKTIKVIPRAPYEPGALYLLESVYTTKQKTKMTVLPFEMTDKK